MQTILVIDDDESLRDTIGVMLEQEGFRAVLTGDGREGFEKAITIKPDLALVDLRLPGMTGVEICKQLRGANLATPIIVLSAAGDELDKVLLLEIGAAYLLVFTGFAWAESVRADKKLQSARHTSQPSP